MKTIVVKIGGSIFGNHDTTLEDLVVLQKRGVSSVVVHGGAQEVSGWLSRLGIPTSFVDGSRVTDVESLKVVAAVLGGLVNKELVVAIQALGGRAIGLSGSDGNLLWASIKKPEMGYVGEIVAVDSEPLILLLEAGYIPVVAPLSSGSVEGKTMLLNVNGDVVAGEIAAALAAEKLVFLTDVNGIYDKAGKVIPKLDVTEARNLIVSGIASRGMIPKLESSIRALTTVPVAHIIDGRIPNALLNVVAVSNEIPRLSSEQTPQSRFGGTTIVST